MCIRGSSCTPSQRARTTDPAHQPSAKTEGTEETLTYFGLVPPEHSSDEPRQPPQGRQLACAATVDRGHLELPPQGAHRKKARLDSKSGPSRHEGWPGRNARSHHSIDAQNIRSRTHAPTILDGGDHMNRLFGFAATSHWIADFAGPIEPIPSRHVLGAGAAESLLSLSACAQLPLIAQLLALHHPVFGPCARCRCRWPT